VTIKPARAGIILALCIAVILSSCGSGANRLAALGTDVTNISVSGLSAGGYMAGQFLVAHSKTVTGAGIVAAGPFGCAESSMAETVGFYPTALAYNFAQAGSGCMASSAGAPSTGTLLRRAKALADDGKIDPISNLERARLYLFSGASDHTVAKPVVEAAQSFFLAAGVPAANIAFVSLPADHGFLTSGHGESCEKSDAPYVNDCHYDQAGAILNFVYGPLEPKAPAKAENFLTFDQKEFAAANATLADEGVAYVPASCRERKGCRVHIVFHGCNQSQASAGDAFIRGSGFADWAETNRIAVLFPQAASSMLNPQGCWDWWGYTGLDFLTRDAPQIKSVAAMLARLGEGAKAP